MVRKVGTWVAAAVVVVLAALVATPGCRIQLCKGSGCGGVPDVGGRGGSGGDYVGGWGGSGGSTEGVDTAADAAILASSDPVELSKAQLRSFR